MPELSAKADRLDRASWHLTSAIALNPVVAALLLGLIAIISYLPGQTNLPAIDRTEPLVALASRYVAQSGDYLRPRWKRNVQRTRPAGTFWVQALGLLAQGEAAANSITTYRLPSLISTTMAIVLMFWLGRSLIGPPAAFMASAMVAVTPIVTLHAQLAIAEPLILPSIVVAQLSVLAIYLEPERARWPGWLGALWLSLGVSTWFNALAVPLLALLTVTTLAMWDRRWDLVRQLQPWLGAPLLVVLALPWLTSVWVIDGAGLYRGMGWRTILDAIEGGQSMKFETIHGVFILTLLLGFVPVAHMLGPVVARYWRARHDPTPRMLLVWLIAPIVALEVLSNKPPLYTVQAVMPAGAMLVALAIARSGSLAISVSAWRGMFVGTCILLIVIVPALVGAVLWVTDTPLTPQIAVGFLLFTACFIVAGWVSAHGFAMAWFTTAVTGTFILGLWLNGLLLPGLRNFWTAPQIETATAALRRCTAGPVYVSGFREPSLTLALLGRAEIGSAQTAASGLAARRAGSAIVESRQFEAFNLAAKLALTDNKLERRGCIRSFNLARGCSLLFDVYSSAETGACKLELNQDCLAKHEFLSTRLQIPHCG